MPAIDDVTGTSLQIWDELSKEIQDPSLATGRDVLKGPIDAFDYIEKIDKTEAVFNEIANNPDLTSTNKLEKISELFATWQDFPLTQVYHDFVETLDDLVTTLINALSPNPDPGTDPGTDPGPGPGDGSGGWPPGFPTPPKDPLVLDLDGDGIELVSVENSQTYFDFNKDTFAEKTGWVAPSDGFLFHDQNGDGVANGIDELFGSALVDGFTELREHDANGDNRIDASDATFTQLRIWQDLNQDGVSTPNEISSLAQWNIVSLGLERSEIRQISEGNEIRYGGSVTFEDATTHASGAVYFAQNSTLTRWTNPNNIQISDDVKILPQIVGYGTLVDLQYALAIDSTLQVAVEDLISSSTEMTSAQLMSDFEDILYQWADVDDVAANSRGYYVDARQVAFLEAFFGTELKEGQQGDINQRFALTLTNTYEDVKGALFLRFASQVAVSAVATGQNLESVTDSPLFAFVSLRYDAIGDRFEGDIDSVMETLVTRLPEEIEDVMSYLDVALPLLRGGAIEFGEGDSAVLKDHIVNQFSAIADPVIQEMVKYLYDSKYVVTGSVMDEVLSSTQGKTTFLGGQGDDSLTGGSSGDLYIYRRGDGHDIITDNNGGGDRLVLANIVASDVSLTTSGGTSFNGGFHPVIIIAESSPGAGDGGSITLYDQLDGLTQTNVDEIVFQDGTIWTKQDVHDMLLAQQVSDGDDNVLGYYTNDTIHAGKGNDYIAGSLGFDTYTYTRGDGDDTIYDYGGYDADDHLIFSGVDSTDVSLYRKGNDVVITISESAPGQGDGGSIVLKDQMLLGGTFTPGIDLIIFADGVTWDRAVLATAEVAPIIGTAGNDTLTGTTGDDVFQGGKGDDTLAGGDGSDTYIYASGDGSDYISEASYQSDKIDTFKFSDLNASDISATRVGGDLRLTVIATGDVITIDRQSDDPTSWKGIERIEFADGAFWDRATILTVPNGPGDTIIGTPNDDELTGTDGDDIFEGGSGDDLLLGGGGSDTYIYSSGDGSDYIDDEANEPDSIDTLKFSDLNASDISAVRVGAHLTIKVLATGDIITIDEQWYSPNAYWGFEKIEFADGTSWDRSVLMAIEAAPNPNQMLTGTTGDDVLDGGPGDDLILGGPGSDTYLYSSGDGNDYIDDGVDEAGDIDLLVFTDLNASDIAAFRIGKDLQIVIDATGESIGVGNQWSNANGYFGLEKIQFSDGTFWDRSTIMAIVDPTVDPNDETLTGTTGNDILEGGLGNDLLLGGEGSDTYIYSLGDGSDLIDDEGGEAGEIDALEFADLNASDITVLRKGASLELTVNATGHAITVNDQWNDLAEYRGLEKIKFADGTSWDRSTIMAIEADPDQVLTGTVGNDVLEGGLGDDLLLGDEGSDTYIYSSGDGNDYIDDEANDSSEIDTLVFTDLTAADVTAARKGVNLEISVNASGHVITIDEQWYNPAQHWGLERIEFADGTFWDRSTIMAIQADPNDQVLTGTAGDDLLEGGLGDDRLLGAEGSDTYIYSSGDGDDYIDDEANEPGEIDALVFTDLNAADITAERAGLHLNLTINATGDIITVDEQWYNPNEYWGLEKIEFADGTFWDRSTIMAIEGDSSSPTASRVDEAPDDTSQFDTSNFVASGGHSPASPVPSSSEFGSADVIAFPAASITRSPSYDLPSYAVGEDTRAETVQSAEIVSFANLTIPSGDDDDNPDFWFEPEPIGALV